MGCDSEFHKEHLCALKKAEKTELVRCLSDRPTVECGNCGAKANRPDNVCKPVKLANP